MILFGFFALLLVLGIVTKMVAGSRTSDRYLLELTSKVTTYLVSLGLLGVFLAFFSFERIRFFGARFWYPLWLLMAVLWGISLVRYAKREIPARREQSMEQKAKQKYFPPRRK